MQTELTEAIDEYSRVVKGFTFENATGDDIREEARACEVLLEQLQALKSKIRGQAESEADETEEERRFCRSFYLADGWIPLLTFLETVSLPLLTKFKDFEVQERNMSDVSIYCLILLKDLCFSVPELAESLGERDDLICTLVESLTIMSLYEFIAYFCETILSARKGPVFELRRVRNLESLIASFNACQLVCFCRIMSHVTTDASETMRLDGKHFESFELLDQKRRMAIGETLGTDLVAMNHSLLVSTSRDLIPRIIQLLGNMESNEAEKRLWLSKSNTYWNPIMSEESRRPQGDDHIAENSIAIQEENETHSVISLNGETVESNHRPQKTIWTMGVKLMAAILRLFSKRELISMIKYIKEMFRSAWNSLTRLRSSSSRRDSVLLSIVQEPNGDGAAAANTLPDAVLAMLNEDDQASQFSDDEHMEDTNASQEHPALAETDYVMSSAFWAHRLHRDFWQLTQRLDLACVISTLCIGSCKRLVQDMLTRCGLVRALTDRFDSLSWDPSFNPRHLPSHARVHGDGCACDPHGTFRGQLLRLVHNYCDRESDNRLNKSQLFSRYELNAMKWDYRQLQQGETPPFGWQKITVMFRPSLVRPQGILDADWQRMHERDALTRLEELGLPGGCPAEHGLAWRIAAVLVAGEYVSGDATLHFWIYAALEALLRGSTRDLKMMLSSWGLLRAVISALAKQSAIEAAKPVEQRNIDEDDDAGFLQTSFDLLGELIKDNPDALGWLCGAECEVLGPSLGFETFQRVCNVAMNHLVDGNVFIRSLGLTLHRNPSNPNLAPIRTWLDENVVKISRGLWSVVGLNRVSQENLCCLNTAVVLLTFQRWGDRLEQFISDVANLSVIHSPFFSQFDTRNDENPQVLLRKLLWFWRCYYSCRTCDRKSLEYSSALKFGDLEETVNRLCDTSGPNGSILVGHDIIHIPYKGSAIAVTCKVDLAPWSSM